jgi:hypothetical protein
VHPQQADDLAVVVDEQELAKTPVLRHSVTLEAKIEAGVPVKDQKHVLTAAQAAAQADLLVLARLLHSDVQQRRVDQALLLARQHGLLLARQHGLLPLGAETTQRIAGTLTKLKISVPRLVLHDVLDKRPSRGKVEGTLPKLNRSFYARCIR